MATDSQTNTADDDLGPMAEAALDRIEDWVRAGGPLRVALHAERRIVRVVPVEDPIDSRSNQ